MACSSPVRASQRRTVLSAEAVTTRVLSALMDAALTPPSWPLRTSNNLPVAVSQMQAVLAHAMMIHAPSLLKAGETGQIVSPSLMTASFLPVAGYQTLATGGLEGQSVVSTRRLSGL